MSDSKNNQENKFVVASRRSGMSFRLATQEDFKRAEALLPAAQARTQAEEDRTVALLRQQVEEEGGDPDDLIAVVQQLLGSLPAGTRDRPDDEYPDEEEIMRRPGREPVFVQLTPAQQEMFRLAERRARQRRDQEMQ